jgi:hypothetical protein
MMQSKEAQFDSLFVTETLRIPFKFLDFWVDILVFMRVTRCHAALNRIPVRLAASMLSNCVI